MLHAEAPRDCTDVLRRVPPNKSFHLRKWLTVTPQLNSQGQTYWSGIDSALPFNILELQEKISIDLKHYTGYAQPESWGRVNHQTHKNTLVFVERIMRCGLQLGPNWGPSIEALLSLFHMAGGGVYDAPKAVTNDTETSPALASNMPCDIHLENDPFLSGKWTIYIHLWMIYLQHIIFTYWKWWFSI